MPGLIVLGLTILGNLCILCMVEMTNGNTVLTQEIEYFSAGP